MTKKKTPQTIEECNAELERTQKQLQQYENRSKMLDRRLAIEKRKERNHRLCSRGGFIESIVPELITMTDEDAQTAAEYEELKAAKSEVRELQQIRRCIDAAERCEQQEQAPSLKNQIKQNMEL